MTSQQEESINPWWINSFAFVQSRNKAAWANARTLKFEDKQKSKMVIRAFCNTDAYNQKQTEAYKEWSTYYYYYYYF